MLNIVPVDRSASQSQGKIITQRIVNTHSVENAELHSEPTTRPLQIGAIAIRVDSRRLSSALHALRVVCGVLSTMLSISKLKAIVEDLRDKLTRFGGGYGCEQYQQILYDIMMP